MTVLPVLTVLAVLETQWRAPCPPLSLLQNTGQRRNRDGFDGFGGYGGFGRDGYPPLNSTPLFRRPEMGIDNVGFALELDRAEANKGRETHHVIVWGETCYGVCPLLEASKSGIHLCSRDLEAQQRYFSYRALLLAIVSQNPFVLVLWGIAHLSRDTLQNGVSHRCAYVKRSAKGGYRTILGELLTSLKNYRAIWGIAAIVSHYRAIWGH